MSYRPSFRIEVVILFQMLTMWKTYLAHRNFCVYRTPSFENKDEFKSLICNINLRKADNPQSSSTILWCMLLNNQYDYCLPALCGSI